MELNRVLILGSNGGFGRLFTGALAAAGMEVAGCDLGDATLDQGACTRYERADVTDPGPGVVALARETDCLLATLPEHAALVAIGKLIPVLRQDSLVVDTLSVKTPVAEMLRGVRKDIEYLSINPLFAPDLGFRGQNVAAIPLAPGARTEYWMTLMRSWGTSVVAMSAEEHDRLAALTQVATHAALLTLGDCLARIGYAPEALGRLSTPPFRVLFALLARLLGHDPDVYWRIQTDNEHAPAVRAAFAEAARELEFIGRTRDQNRFLAIFDRARKAMGSAVDPLRTDFLRLPQVSSPAVAPDSRRPRTSCRPGGAGATDSTDGPSAIPGIPGTPAMESEVHPEMTHDGPTGGLSRTDRPT
jgi:prephenate dehydrogenase